MTEQKSLPNFEIPNPQKLFKHQWQSLLLELSTKSKASPNLYPVEQDHCFARILLDTLFQDCWYNHIKKPATKHLTLKQKDYLLTLGKEILHTPQKSFQMQQESLQWRRKLKPRQNPPTENFEAIHTLFPKLKYHQKSFPRIHDPICIPSTIKPKNGTVPY